MYRNCYLENLTMQIKSENVELHALLYKENEKKQLLDNNLKNMEVYINNQNTELEELRIKVYPKFLIMNEFITKNLLDSCIFFNRKSITLYCCLFRFLFLASLFEVIQYYE